MTHLQIIEWYITGSSFSFLSIFFISLTFLMFLNIFFQSFPFYWVLLRENFYKI